MAARATHFTEHELDLIREVLAEREARSKNTKDRPGKDRQPLPSPKCYMIRTPTGGIPALSKGADVGTGTGTTETLDDVPGYAEFCQVYQRVGDLSAARFHAVINFLITVYNSSEYAIPAGQWIPVTRDEYGTWWVPAQGLEFDAC